MLSVIYLVNILARVCEGKWLCLQIQPCRCIAAHVKEWWLPLHISQSSPVIVDCHVKFISSTARSTCLATWSFQQSTCMYIATHVKEWWLPSLLVRPNLQGCFSLSLKHPGGVAYYPIKRKDSGLYEVVAVFLCLFFSTLYLTYR